MNLDPSQGIAVFTDGSSYYKDRSGGWAYVALDAFNGLHTAAGGESDVTNNQMELQAVIEALTELYAEFGACDVLVQSDSEYVVLGCQDQTRKRNKNQEYWKWLDKAIEKHQHVEFEHVYGHADNMYNEMADQLAGKARREL